ncbi:DUF3617 domain-containing protein [Novosphingobium beihaiensis]|uniref:DUF3617 domain-containing protein n=1 Tax=Novosphingobium beihaiensis TaxID=2930389 RepID=A0ABT0BVQ7_9SPHN|nr:DUF3617 domain-containing protein [Novosphingobium beihaiensis]MCJ2188973.1 DUF3617 domain-containing protein [Novosphingobium beihaiensis]
MTNGSMRKGALGACLTVLALPLAACGSKEEAKSESAAPSAAETAGTPMSADEAAQAAARLERPRPGSYKQTIEVMDLQIAGLPENAASQMKGMIRKTDTHTFCITDEDNDDGYKDMLQNAGQGGDCTYSKFDVAGGRLDAQMHCAMPGQGDAVMTMNGTVSETGSDVIIGMDVTGGQPPMGNMKMKMHMIAERVGDCPS